MFLIAITSDCQVGNIGPEWGTQCTTFVTQTVSREPDNTGLGKELHVGARFEQNLEIYLFVFQGVTTGKLGVV